jgi:hypothetical protein
VAATDGLGTDAARIAMDEQIKARYAGLSVASVTVASPDLEDAQ